MQRAVGQPSTPQELIAAVKTAVQSGAVQTLSLTYSAQRRVVLEAVAFGSFLRDVETRVVNDYAELLSPAPER